LNNNASSHNLHDRYTKQQQENLYQEAKEELEIIAERQTAASNRRQSKSARQGNCFHTIRIGTPRRRS